MLCGLPFSIGEGVPDLLKMIITLSQNRLTEQLMYMELLQCTVLEVKVIEGLGHTVDVVLVNGTLKEGKRGREDSFSRVIVVLFALPSCEKSPS